MQRAVNPETLAQHRVWKTEPGEDRCAHGEMSPFKVYIFFNTYFSKQQRLIQLLKIVTLFQTFLFHKSFNKKIIWPAGFLHPEPGSLMEVRC